MTPHLSLRRKVTFVVAAILLPVVPIAAAVGVTEYRFHNHGREELFGYVNSHGYRGSVLGRKRSGEFRVVIVGGSTVYGQGVETNRTIPAILEERLRHSGRDVSVANLGYMNDGAYADGLGVPAIDEPPDGPVRAVLHRSQTAATMSYLHRQFDGEARLRVADMGEAIDLRRPTYRIDNLHLTADGNAIVAEGLMADVIDIAASRAQRSN